MTEDIIVVYIYLPQDEANRVSQGLMEQRLAACINIIPRIESYYWWNDKVERDVESLLMIKTTKNKFDSLRDWVVENHPYDLPEIIAVPLATGHSDYITWIKKETEG
jgi:periplasmic divalent cation tolerance protein